MFGVNVWEGISAPLNNLDLVSKKVSQHIDLFLPPLYLPPWFLPPHKNLSSLAFLCKTFQNILIITANGLSNSFHKNFGFCTERHSIGAAANSEKGVPTLMHFARINTFKFLC